MMMRRRRLRSKRRRRMRMRSKRRRRKRRRRKRRKRKRRRRKIRRRMRRRRKRRRRKRRMRVIFSTWSLHHLGTTSGLAMESQLPLKSSMSLIRRIWKCKRLIWKWPCWLLSADEKVNPNGDTVPWSTSPMMIIMIVMMMTMTLMMMMMIIMVVIMMTMTLHSRDTVPWSLSPATSCSRNTGAL